MPPDPARSARQHRAFHRLERQAYERERLAYDAWERDNSVNIERWRMVGASASRARHNAAYAAGAYPDARRARRTRLMVEEHDRLCEADRLMVQDLDRLCN
jgi:hypothetical protein